MLTAPNFFFDLKTVFTEVLFKFIVGPGRRYNQVNSVILTNQSINDGDDDYVDDGDDEQWDHFDANVRHFVNSVLAPKSKY